MLRVETCIYKKQAESRLPREAARPGPCHWGKGAASLWESLNRSPNTGAGITPLRPSSIDGWFPNLLLAQKLAPNKSYPNGHNISKYMKAAAHVKSEKLFSEPSGSMEHSTQSPTRDNTYLSRTSLESNPLNHAFVSVLPAPLPGRLLPVPIWSALASYYWLVFLLCIPTALNIS